jgi:hypothetical protein
VLFGPLKCESVRMCAGFRMPGWWDYPRAPAAGVRKAPRHDIAGCGGGGAAGAMGFDHESEAAAKRALPPRRPIASFRAHTIIRPLSDQSGH